MRAMNRTKSCRHHDVLNVSYGDSSMYRVDPQTLPARSARRPARAGPRAARPTARPRSRDAAAPAARVGLAGRRRRAADRPLHPRHRQPDRRRAGRRRRRNRRPRRRDAGRARHAGRARARSSIRLSPVETEAQPEGSRGQRRADRSAARRSARTAPSTSTRSRSRRTPRPPRAGAERVRPHPVAARPARRLAVGVRPAPDADGSGAPAVRIGQERRGAAVSGAAGRPRARHARPARRSPTRPFARRLPASSPSAWCRPATTSPRA